MRNKASTLAADIMEMITNRFVVYGTPIPENILELKDETMSIFMETCTFTDDNLPPHYEQRLLEIREELSNRLIKGE